MEAEIRAQIPNIDPVLSDYSAGTSHLSVRKTLRLHTRGKPPGSAIM